MVKRINKYNALGILKAVYWIIHGSKGNSTLICKIIKTECSEKKKEIHSLKSYINKIRKLEKYWSVFKLRT